jgi:beta-glucosidase
MFGKEATCPLTHSEIEEKALSLLGQMTLKEKVWLLNGNWDILATMRKGSENLLSEPFVSNGLKRLNVSPIRFSDGPRGAVVGNSTCFPVSMARGASFDRDLERRVGDAIGKELRAQGANYYGGVCVNLLRHPAWGRAQETYGEDPFHVGEMGVQLMQGVQAHNVMACVKHFALNSIENSRFFVNVKVDDRTLHEVYLPHFKKIVQAGAASVMGAYNRVNGEQACESPRLLTEILRDDWGFEGFTLSDFLFGIRDGEKAIRAGMDMEMPLPVEYQRNLLSAVQAGRVSETAVDAAALRILRTLLVFENTPDPVAYDASQVASPEHVALAREAAEKSMVLLKNSGQVLPFSKRARRVLVLGKLASEENTGDRGSSRVRPPYVITPLEGLRRYLGPDVEVVHYDETQVDAARPAATAADCVVIVVGCDYNDEGEFLTPANQGELMQIVSTGYRNMGHPLKGFFIKLFGKLARRPGSAEGLAVGGDRQSLALKSGQRRMIEELAPLNPNTVVCLVSGSMILTQDWADKTPAVLYSWYAGMEGGTALARILFGDVNPSGKLPFTVPARAEDLPYFSSSDPEVTYDLYHGYTLLDKCGLRPAYPFGFGLSYTSFAFSDLRVEACGDRIGVRVRVSNTGARDGEEVAQVYIGMAAAPGSRPRVDRQKKLLKGFAKVALAAGASADVSIEVPLAELRYYDEQEQGWRFEPGVYQVLVGSSSDDGSLLGAVVELPPPDCVGRKAATAAVAAFALPE